MPPPMTGVFFTYSKFKRSLEPVMFIFSWLSLSIFYSLIQVPSLYQKRNRIPDDNNEKLFRSGNVIYPESVKATPKLDQSCSLTLHFHYYGHPVNKAKFSWLICDRITGATVVT